MLKAYKYRIYPNANQRELLAQHFGCVRWVYNWGLARKKEHYEKTQKSLPKRILQDELVALKKTQEKNWLSDVNSQSLLASLFDLNRAYQNFFKKRAKHPKFKKKNNTQTYQCPQHVKVDLEKGLLHLPKIKNIKIKLHRSFIGLIKTVTLKKNASGSYYASILIDNGIPIKTPFGVSQDKTIGIDLGLTHFAIDSEGNKKSSPKYLKNSLRKLAMAQRIKSRKDYKNQSKNYVKQRIKVAKIHEVVTNKRKDFIHQYTAELVYKNQATSFAIEDLHVKGMIKNKKLSRAIADSGWGMFVRCLSYKSEWYGKNVLPINRFIASTKTCHQCGYKKDKLPLSIRNWHCVCGVSHDRDINAAKMIRKEALADALGRSVSIKSSSTTIPISVGVVAKG